MKPKGLSGYTVVKNALSLDYAIRDCLDSLLKVCDEVVVGEMGSDDGTLTFLLDWAAHEPRLRIVMIDDWTAKRGDRNWFVSALNQIRGHLRFSMQLELDADEVLGDDPETIAAIKHAVDHTNAFAFDRLNFVRDATSLIPENECCGRWVVRIGPSHLWMPSDEPHVRGEIHLLDMAYNRPGAMIYHLGFLRRPEAFYAKAKVVLGAFFDNYDPRLAAAEAEGKPPLSGFEWWNRLTPYSGPYPAAVRHWMEARGYKVP